MYVILGLALGSHGFGLVGSDAEANDLRLLADITLALILFSDAAHSNLGVLKAKASYPTRMLSLGLPGAILLGFAGAALLFPQLSLIEAGILGTMLAATDAALGKAVITNEKVPAEVREGLNVESGLNDGLCVPILLVLIAMGSSAHAEVSGSHALMLVAEELGIGLVVGLGFAFIGAKLLTLSAQKEWLSEVWVQLTVATLALASFGVAQTLHGSGYIAAFSGGLLFGHLHEKHTHKLVLTTESIAELFAMLTWILFGAAVVSQVFDLFNSTIILYAAISLTLVRMLPIYLSFLGTDVQCSATIHGLVRSARSSEYRVCSDCYRGRVTGCPIYCSSGHLHRIHEFVSARHYRKTTGQPDWQIKKKRHLKRGGVLVTSLLCCFNHRARNDPWWYPNEPLSLASCTAPYLHYLMLMPVRWRARDRSRPGPCLIQCMLRYLQTPMRRRVTKSVTFS